MQIQVKKTALKRAVIPVASEQSIPIPSGRPTFEHVITLQHGAGYWYSNTRPHFAAYFKDGQTDDADVRQALEALSASLTPEADKETILVTLLAIYVLTEIFDGKEDEWTLLVRKAKTFLKGCGVTKPDRLLQEFKLQLA